MPLPYRDCLRCDFPQPFGMFEHRRVTDQQPSGVMECPVCHWMTIQTEESPLVQCSWCPRILSEDHLVYSDYEGGIGICPICMFETLLQACDRWESDFSVQHCHPEFLLLLMEQVQLRPDVDWRAE